MIDSCFPGEASLITPPGCQPAGGPDHGLRQLPGTPWSVRTAGGPPAWPSLEVYGHGVLLDVVVATPLSAGFLRGACRDDGRQAIAWGRLPADGAPLAVRFTGGGIRRSSQPATVTEVGWWFWVALADGEFAAVTLAHRGGQERCRVRRVKR